MKSREVYSGSGNQGSQELKACIQLDHQHVSEVVPDESIDDLHRDVTRIRYPVLEFPKTIKSHNFDKDPIVEGTLMGIKGQYLMFDTSVINIRKFSSYQRQHKYEGIP